MDKHSAFGLSQTDGRPLYVQIMDRIRERVAAGQWPPGHELPSIRQLAADLRVSVITVKRAYLELEREKIIQTRQGKGSFVAQDASPSRELLHQDLQACLRDAVRIADMLGMTQKEMLTHWKNAREELRQDQHERDEQAKGTP